MEKQILKAFSNPVRLKIISCLDKKPKNVSQLIKICKISQSAVSQHLAKLKKAGLVKDKKLGKNVYYKLLYPKARDISNKLQEFMKEVQK